MSPSPSPSPLTLLVGGLDLQFEGSLPRIRPLVEQVLKEVGGPIRLLAAGERLGSDRTGSSWAELVPRADRGTGNFLHAFARLEEEGTPPEALIGLYSSNPLPTRAPKYPVLWVSSSPTRLPGPHFGALLPGVTSHHFDLAETARRLPPASALPAFYTRYPDSAVPASQCYLPRPPGEGVGHSPLLLRCRAQPLSVEEREVLLREALSELLVQLNRHRSFQRACSEDRGERLAVVQTLRALGTPTPPELEQQLRARALRSPEAAILALALLPPESFAPGDLLRLLARHPKKPGLTSLLALHPQATPALWETIAHRLNESFCNSTLSTLERLPAALALPAVQEQQVRGRMGEPERLQALFLERGPEQFASLSAFLLSPGTLEPWRRRAISELLETLPERYLRLVPSTAWASLLGASDPAIRLLAMARLAAAPSAPSPPRRQLR